MTTILTTIALIVLAGSIVPVLFLVLGAAAAALTGALDK